MSFCVGVKLFFSGDGFADPSSCCKAGFRPARASCLIRAKYWYSQATQSCKNEFLRCCFNATGEKGNVIKMYQNLSIKVVCRQTIFSFTDKVMLNNSKNLVDQQNEVYDGSMIVLITCRRRTAKRCIGAKI